MFTLTIPFPNINPVIFNIGPFSITWYGVAYMVGIYLAYLVLMRVTRSSSYPHRSITPSVIEDFLLYAVLGIIIGGRLFYTLVYNWSIYSQNLLGIITPPFSGMSFHGGFLGIIVATFLISRKHNISVRAFGDLLAMVAPIGIFFGRIANFINGELWGRVTDVAWGVVFPGQTFPRHPSQLYEAGLEGLLLGLIMLVLYKSGALAKRGFLIGVFFLGYGAARIFVELFRVADEQFIDLATNPNGYVIRLGDYGLSMGQSLSLPMVFIGLAFIWYSHKNP